ncbi:MAG: 50S ribosomal protein L10 [Haloferacaceae archaeon]
MSESERASARRTETIPQWKREEVDELATFLERYDSVGIVDVAGIPSRQLQSMRRDLHGQAELRMSRNTLLRRALEDADEGLETLVEYVSGQVGLVGTNDNPFGLYQQLEASKTPAPINAGEVAPNDIVIPEGDTGVDPGPFVGELQSVGAEARIMEGSIQVTADSVVCEAGEEVSADLADVLGELGIEPKEVGLDLRAVYSEGVLFEPDELAIDVSAYRADVQAGAAAARNLSINASYPTARTVGSLLGKAAGEAKAVGLYTAIEDPDVMPDLVARADAQVRALTGLIDDEEALPEELRGVEAPGAPAGGADEGDEAGEADEEQADDQATEAEAEEAGDEDDDDDDAGAEGLGEMFG